MLKGLLVFWKLDIWCHKCGRLKFLMMLDYNILFKFLALTWSLGVISFTHHWFLIAYIENFQCSPQLWSVVQVTFTQHVLLDINFYPVEWTTHKHHTGRNLDHQEQLIAKPVNAMTTMECTVLHGALHYQ